MALQDFTISFTTSAVIQFNDYTEGTIGPASTLFADIGALEKIGPAATLFSDIAALNKIGPGSTLSPSQLESFFLESDIIHYSEIAEFRADEIILKNNTTLRGAGFVRNWGMETVKLNVIDTQVDRILNVDESKSVVINNGAGSAITLSLPENTPIGVAYTFVRTSSSGSIDINTENNSGALLDSSGSVASGISLNSIGSKLSVVSLGNNTWVTISSQNTLTTDWSVSLISGLSLHLDASNESSLTITSGIDIEQWDDLSSQGNNVSQSIAVNKPHTSGIINGLNAIDFDGTNHYLINSTAGGTFTGVAGDLYVVLEVPSITLSNNTIFGSADEGGTTRFVALSILNSSAGSKSSIQQRNNDTGDTLSGNSILVDTPTVVRLFSTGTSYGAEFNGILHPLVVVGGADNGDWFGDTTSRDSFTIGNLLRDSSINLYEGTIGEIIYFDNKVLTNTEKSILTRHLKSKWGI